MSGKWFCLTVLLLVVAVLVVTLKAAGKKKAETKVSIKSSLVAPGAKVRKLAGGFKFTEGPAADAKGNVFFSDIPNSRIHKWSLTSGLSTFREDSGRANGLFFDKAGRLMACEGGTTISVHHSGW